MTGTGHNYELGQLVIEGKTKQVWDLPMMPGHVLVLSKDRITAGDGVKAHDLEGKATISNQTNGKVFELLNSFGLKTAYVKSAGEKSFIARKCEMVPIEWVTRRLATGSFLKRHPGVPEGFRFGPPLQETFYKDDANHDPQWSEEQIVSARFKVSGLTIGQDEVDIMRRTTVVVFEVLERAWATRDCALIDMKIEFGVDSKGEILVADVIDSDSWRLWPSGDKRLMKDKQVYRNLSTVTKEDLDTVKRNFKWVAEQLDLLTQDTNSLVVVLMGSPSDEEHCKKIAKYCKELGLICQLRVTSAHKGTEETLKILAQYEGSNEKVVLIAVAGRSNGLGPVLSGNTPFPVINCPPVKPETVGQDIWSSLNVPSGLGCTTVVYPEAAAIAAAQIHALHDYIIWSRLRVKQLNNFISLKVAEFPIPGYQSLVFFRSLWCKVKGSSSRFNFLFFWLHGQNIQFEFWAGGLTGLKFSSIQITFPCHVQHTPNSMSPTPSTFTATRTPENTEEDPDDPEPADEGDPSRVLL